MVKFNKAYTQNDSPGGSTQPKYVLSQPSVKVTPHAKHTDNRCWRKSVSKKPAVKHKFAFCILQNTHPNLLFISWVLQLL